LEHAIPATHVPLGPQVRVALPSAVQLVSPGAHCPEQAAVLPVLVQVWWLHGVPVGHWPVASQVWGASLLPQPCAPGVQTPQTAEVVLSVTHAPPEHDDELQAVPVWLHVRRLLPEHWVSPG
jgi:hypothetical protein